MLQKLFAKKATSCARDGEVTVPTDEGEHGREGSVARQAARHCHRRCEAYRPREQAPADPNRAPSGLSPRRLCGQTHVFNLRAATRVATNDKAGSVKTGAVYEQMVQPVVPGPVSIQGPSHKSFIFQIF